MPRLALCLLAATVLFGSPALATGSTEILVAECHKQLKLGDSGCACVADRANEKLNESQQALVAAMVTQNQAAVGELQSSMSAEEVSGAMTFMAETPQICATQ